MRYYGSNITRNPQLLDIELPVETNSASGQPHAQFLEWQRGFEFFFFTHFKRPIYILNVVSKWTKQGKKLKWFKRKKKKKKKKSLKKQSFQEARYSGWIPFLKGQKLGNISSGVRIFPGILSFFFFFNPSLCVKVRSVASSKFVGQVFECFSLQFHPLFWFLG